LAVLQQPTSTLLVSRRADRALMVWFRCSIISKRRDKFWVVESSAIARVRPRESRLQYISRVQTQNVYKYTLRIENLARHRTSIQEEFFFFSFLK
jgi:hypothetical protein